MAITLKDDQGGIVAIHVDESFDMRTLKAGPKDQADAKTLKSTFAVARP